MKPFLYYDIECFRDLFLICTLDDTGKQGELLYRHEDTTPDPDAIRALFPPDHYYVSFNGLGYDSYMIACALTGKNTLQQLREINDMIIRKSGASPSLPRITRSDILREPHLFPPKHDQIDLMIYADPKVNTPHNNHRSKTRPPLVSLKTLVARAGVQLINEYPMDNDTVPDEDVARVVAYCHEDVNAVKTLTAHFIESHILPRDLFQERIKTALREAYPGKKPHPSKWSLMNKTDSRFGEMVFLSYVGERDDKRHHPEITFKDTIPPELKKKIPQVIKALKPLENKILSSRPGHKKELYIVHVGKLPHLFGYGGLHSKTKPGFYRADTTWGLMDIDAESFYPKLMLNYKIVPLGFNEETYINGLKTLWNERVQAKRAGNKTLANGLKRPLNSLYGKLNQWLYGSTDDEDDTLYNRNHHDEDGDVPPLSDGHSGFRVTIPGQLLIIELIRRLGEIGCPTLSTNTDGVTFAYPKAKKDALLQALSSWESDFDMSLEKKELDYIVIKDVNSIIYGYPDAPPKSVGGLRLSPDINHSPSAPVIAKAVLNHFLHGTPFTTTVANETDLACFLSIANGRGFKINGEKVRGIMRYAVGKKKVAAVTPIGKSFSPPNPIHVPDVNLLRKEDLDLNWYAREAKKRMQGVKTIIPKPPSLPVAVKLKLPKIPKEIRDKITACIHSVSPNSPIETRFNDQEKEIIKGAVPAPSNPNQMLDIEFSIANSRWNVTTYDAALNAEYKEDIVKIRLALQNKRKEIESVKCEDSESNNNVPVGEATPQDVKKEIMNMASTNKTSKHSKSNGKGGKPPDQKPEGQKPEGQKPPDQKPREIPPAKKKTTRSKGGAASAGESATTKAPLPPLVQSFEPVPPPAPSMSGADFIASDSDADADEEPEVIVTDDRPPAPTQPFLFSRSTPPTVKMIQPEDKIKLYIPRSEKTVDKQVALFREAVYIQAKERPESLSLYHKNKVIYYINPEPPHHLVTPTNEQLRDVINSRLEISYVDSLELNHPFHMRRHGKRVNSTFPLWQYSKGQPEIFPYLDFYSPHEILLPDGTFISNEGYDKERYVYIQKQLGIDVNLPPEQAGGKIRELLKDFPFESDQHLSRAVAAFYLAILRTWFQLVPFCMTNSPQNQVGKSKLVKLISTIATGKNTPPSIQAASGLEEIKYSLAENLSTLPRMVLADNVSEVKHSAFFSQLATLNEIVLRRVKDTARAYNLTNTLFTFSGQDLTLTNELAKRTLEIRLAFPDGDPAKRGALPNIELIAMRDRAAFLSAFLSGANHWIKQGGLMVTHPLPCSSTFHDSLGVCSAIIELLGFEALQPSESDEVINTEVEQEDNLLELLALHASETQEDDGYTIKDIMSILLTADYEFPLPNENWIDERKNERSRETSLGVWMRRKSRNPLGRYRLECKRDRTEYGGRCHRYFIREK